MSVQVLTSISDVTANDRIRDGGRRARGFAGARVTPSSRGSTRECTSRDRSLRSRDALSRRPLRALSLSHLLRRAPRLRAGARHGAFGGDPDNFNFPRYCLDFSFLRLYENGAPVATPNHLHALYAACRKTGVVLVAGNPGGTSRLRTTAQLAFQRDTGLPWQHAALSEQRGQFIAYSSLGPDQARDRSRRAVRRRESVEGALAAGGRRWPIRRASRRVAERRSRSASQRVRRNPRRNARDRRCVGRDRRAQAAHRGHVLSLPVCSSSAPAASVRCCSAGRADLVRGAEEREKPDAERLPRYAEAQPANCSGSAARAQARSTPEFEALHLEFWLTKMREYLTADDPVARRILGSEIPEALAERLSRFAPRRSRLRMQLWEGGAAAIARLGRSDDPSSCATGR